MDARWLLMWLCAPMFSLGALALEAGSLRWYVLEETARGGSHEDYRR